jgi:hypothetical protein
LVTEVARLRGEQRQAEAGLASRRREVGKLDAAIERKRRSLGRVERPPSPHAEPRPPKPHRALAAALADGRLTVERVAEVLRVRRADVPPIAAGKVGLGETAWKRLLREIGG